MRRRHPLPKIWLMTDQRFGDRLFSSIRRLPIGSGVIFRHYELGETQRFALFQQVAHICRQRGHILLLAGSERSALHWRADGFHRRVKRRSKILQSVSVHDRRELAEARRMKSAMMLVSPIFATNSHPGQSPLGLHGLNRMAAKVNGAKIIALGGVTRQKAKLFNQRLIYGWAAIDGLMGRKITTKT
jgi:thiamine-phosphate pyrophosphorylase